MKLELNKPHNKRTICEVHRELYKEIQSLKIKRVKKSVLTTKLKEAFAMAKKMNNKLRQYKHNYDDGWWEKNKLSGGELNK